MKFLPISEALSSPFIATNFTISLLVSSASAAKAFIYLYLRIYLIKSSFN
ncbi:hypothetical protein LEP1GSC061_0860 [Leptospira wolffii serovar Khorat str. Khorat-H2]|nr:hypothetical protein LEP1GSC061_0860 [Leptospira wolffii serovar Khorat str. Khorat-H2]